MSPWLGDASLVEEGTLTTRQMRAMRIFRTAAVAFAVVNWFVTAWEVSRRSVSSDVATLTGFIVGQSTALALVTFLVVMFRPRATPAAGPLYDPRGYTGTAYERLIDHAEQLQQAEADRAAVDGPRIVIVNPDSQVDVVTGKVTGTVAIAEPYAVAEPYAEQYTVAEMPPNRTWDAT